MSASLWAADSLATQIQANGAAARARTTLATQQAYHCGDIAIKNAAIEALLRVNPDHPLFQPGVQDRIFSTGEREFRQFGWERGSSLGIDTHAVLAELLAEFEVARAAAIQKAALDQIKPRRRGWIFFNRRTVFSWQAFEHPTQEAAEESKKAEIRRLQNAQLGDQLGPL